VVQPGEHFWSIAEAQLAAVTSDAPTDAQVAAYWHRLIAANRSVLAIADEPDLLFPDQVLSLPPVEPGPR
jgi:nucleoid-associated protein YgaU